MGDSLTVLYSIGERYATKRLRLTKDGKVRKRPYDEAKHFRVSIIVIAYFAALCPALERLTREPFAFVIRGAPLPGINFRHTRRLVHRDRKTGAEPTFAALPVTGCRSISTTSRPGRSSTRSMIRLMPSST